MDAGDTDAAIAHFRHAIAVQADYFPAHGHMGWAYYRERRWREAAQAFQAAIEHGARSAEFYYELGLALAYQGRCDEARPWLERAIAMEPDSVPAREGLRMCRE